jgi:Toprim domain
VIASLREIARALGGEVAGAQVLAPGPGHGPRDRSMSLRLSANSPLGFLVHSHAGDQFNICQKYVAERLGIDPDGWKHDVRLLRRRNNERPRAAPSPRPQAIAKPNDNAERIGQALEIWRESGHPGGTPIEAYFASRGLELDGDLMMSVLRWNERIAAMVALFRNIETNAPQAISRTFLDNEGRKLGRKFLGPVGGAAIKLDPDENVLGGLHVGEGLETCMAARQLGLRPTWALGSAGAVAAFPVLGGIEAINVIVDHDDNGAGEKAAREVEARWRAAGREVNLIRSDTPGDLNDALKSGVL